MSKIDANSWEFFKSRVLKRKADKDKRIRRDSFNSYMKGSARKNAENMRKNPSALEQRMKDFLDNHGIHYEFQKILYVKNAKSGYINKYYIADFYIPSKNLIIETDGAFHDQQIFADAYRTWDIQLHYPNIKIIRWRWNSFNSPKRRMELVSLLR